MGAKVRNKVLNLTEEQNEIINWNYDHTWWELLTLSMARSAGVDPATGDQLYWVYDNAEDETDWSKHYISNDKSKTAASRVIHGSRIQDIWFHCNLIEL